MFNRRHRSTLVHIHPLTSCGGDECNMQHNTQAMQHLVCKQLLVDTAPHRLVIIQLTANTPTHLITLPNWCWFHLSRICGWHIYQLSNNKLRISTFQHSSSSFVFGLFHRTKGKCNGICTKRCFLLSLCFTAGFALCFGFCLTILSSY